MRVEPASIEQVRVAEDGEWVIIGPDSSSTVAKIQELDPTLRVRLSTTAGMFAVYREGEPVPPILTCRAYQNGFGTWEGLDDRVLRRLEFIDPLGRGGYDFVKEMESMNAAAEKARLERRHQAFAPLGEKAAHALRKDLGVKSRAFIKDKEAGK